MGGGTEALDEYGGLITLKIGASSSRSSAGNSLSEVGGVRQREARVLGVEVASYVGTVGKVTAGETTRRAQIICRGRRLGRKEKHGSE